jgi:C4-type Zn-finger protein
MVGHDQQTAVVMCPGCDGPMKPVERKPIMFTEGLVDVTYFCERCRMRTIRTVSPDNPDDPRAA